MLHAVIRTIDDIPENIREHYTQATDGSYRLDVGEVDGLSLQNVTGLQTALSSERKNRDDERKARIDAEERLKNFGDLDATAARDALTKVGEMENWTPEEKVKAQIEEHQARLSTQYQGQIKEANDSRDAMEAQYSKFLRGHYATTAIAKHDGIHQLLMPHVESAISLVKAEDGSFSPVVLDAQGQPRWSAEDSAKHMGVDEFVSGLKADEVFANVFRGTTAGGSGASSTGSGGGASGANNPFSKDGWNLTKQSELLVNNPTLAGQLKSQAG